MIDIKVELERIKNLILAKTKKVEETEETKVEETKVEETKVEETKKETVIVKLEETKVEETSILNLASVLEVNKWTIDVDNETFKIGDTIVTTYEDGSTTNLSDGEYELEDKRVIQVNSDGVIVMIDGKSEETKVETEEVEAAKEDGTGPDSEAPAEEETKVEYVTKDEFVTLVEAVAELQAALELKTEELNAKTEEVEAAKTEVEAEKEEIKLKKEEDAKPAADPIELEIIKKQEATYVTRILEGIEKQRK